MNKFILYLPFVFIVVLCTSCHTRKKSDAKIDIPVTTIHSKGEKQLNNNRKRILDHAKNWQGVRYKYGGNSKEEGTDCSGMVLQVYLAACNIKLPRNSAAQAEFCSSLEAGDVKPGDLVFFATGKDSVKVSHVGIMLDDDKFIHSSTSKGVCISSLSSPYYQRTFIKFGRVEGL